MKIGILGVGNIGGTLAQHLAAAGHEVKVANSRGPVTIDPQVLRTGARPVPAPKVGTDVDAVIVSIPLNLIPTVAPLLAQTPVSTVVIDTSNYYPGPDNRIEAIEAGQVEGLWVAEQLGRPVVKAWSNVAAEYLATGGRPAGDPDRFALPVAADRDDDRQVAMTLVEDTGFDAVDAGPVAESWRSEPGAPSHATDLPRDELITALAATDRARLTRRRDLLGAVMTERADAGPNAFPPGYITRLSRALYL